MSEKLEEKYKYMCKLCEQMSSSLHKADKIIKENEKQGITIQEYQEIKNKQIRELEEMVSGAQSKEKLLLDYIDNMCGMIYYQVQLKEHDRWLEDCIAQGWFEIPAEDE